MSNPKARAKFTVKYEGEDDWWRIVEQPPERSFQPGRLLDLQEILPTDLPIELVEEAIEALNAIKAADCQRKVKGGSFLTGDAFVKVYSVLARIEKHREGK